MLKHVVASGVSGSKMNTRAAVKANNVNIIKLLRERGNPIVLK